MTGGRAIDRQAHRDRTAPDRLPSCPSCGDLSSPGALRCETCGARLTLDDGYGVRKDARL